MSRREARLLSYVPSGDRWSTVRRFGREFSRRPPRYIAAADGKEERRVQIRQRRRQGSYGLELLFVWPERDLLFAGEEALDLESLSPKGRAGRVDKIVGTLDGRLFGMTAKRDGVELLVELSPESFEEIAAWPVIRTDSIKSQARIDPATKRLYVADMTRARVSVFRLP